MADVELLDLRDRRDGTNIPHGEPVPRVHRETERDTLASRLTERAQRHRISRGMRVLSGVQLYGHRAEILRALHRVEIGCDEQAGANTCRIQAGEPRSQSLRVATHVESALGRDLLAPLWNQRDLVGSQSGGDVEHLVGTGHLEIQHRPHRRAESCDIVVLNVPPVLAQMRGDAVGARTLAAGCREYGVRLVAAPCLTQRRDVIDVDVQALPHHFACTYAVEGAPTTRLCFSVFDAETRVRKLIITMLLLAACKQQQVTTTTVPASKPVANVSGAPDPRSAVQTYMTAVANQDLQAMSRIWGSKDGSVLDTHAMPREEIEKREIVIVCYLRHDNYRIISEAQGPEGERVFATELSRGGLKRATNFYVTQGPTRRWYVRSVDVEPLQDLIRRERCAK
jgi:hypothetical protein